MLNEQFYNVKINNEILEFSTVAYHKALMSLHE